MLLTRFGSKEMETQNLLNQLKSAKIYGLPLIGVIAMSMLMTGAVAGLYVMFVSSPTSAILEVRGLDAQLMQSGNWGRYIDAIDSVTLVDQMYGMGDDVLFAKNSAILVITDQDLVDENLVLTVKVFEDDGVTPYTGSWTCNPRFAEFSRTVAGGGDGAINPSISLGDTQGPWTISYDKIKDFEYDSGAYSRTASGNYNALILCFTFPGVTYAEEGSSLDFNADLNAKAIITLEVNDGL